MTQVHDKLKHLDHLFFFYDRGLADAIEMTLGTYEYPTQRQGENHGSQLNPILGDFDLYVDFLERSNSKPHHLVCDPELLQYAIDEIDAGIYNELKIYFGQHRFMVMEVKELHYSPLDYLVKVYYDAPR